MVERERVITLFQFRQYNTTFKEVDDFMNNPVPVRVT